jgi:hypothetical protein
MRFLQLSLVLVVILISERSNGQSGSDSSQWFSRFEKNGDGKIERKEVPLPLWQRLSSEDTDQNDSVSMQEFEGFSFDPTPPGPPSKRTPSKGKGAGPMARPQTKLTRLL